MNLLLYMEHHTLCFYYPSSDETNQVFVKQKCKAYVVLYFKEECCLIALTKCSPEEEGRRNKNLIIASATSAVYSVFLIPLPLSFIGEARDRIGLHQLLCLGTYEFVWITYFQWYFWKNLLAYVGIGVILKNCCCIWSLRWHFKYNFKDNSKDIRNFKRI